MPSSLSLLAHAYEDDHTRAKMLGIWSAMVGASAAIGPLVGGVLIHLFGWRGVFWVNVPVGVLGILLAQALIRSSAKRERALSMLSHVLGVVILASLTFFLIEGPARGWRSESVLLAAVIASVSVVALVRRERRGAHPLLPPALFRARGFVSINLTGFFINFGAFGQLFLFGLYLQQAQSADALHAGLLLLPMMASITIGNLLSGPISIRVGTRKPMLLGLSIAALAGLTVAVSTQDMPYVVLMLGASIMNLAAGTAIPAMTTTVMKIAGRAHANSAAAALNANRQIGALVGVAVIGSILHEIPSWDTRLPVAFSAIALVYAIAFALVFLHVGREEPALPIA
jgi:DHA2 family methylenomycin A resistance protein-like MFS transporter